jgi:hypothetical protein
MVYKNVVIISNNGDKKPEQITPKSDGTRQLNALHENEHQQYHDDKAQPAAGTISPVAAMAPGRQRAQEHQDNDNQQDQSN